MLDEKQKELELQKWLDSEKAGKDTCGSYDYCKNCDKSLAQPCATAYQKTVKPVAKKTACKTATKATATKTTKTVVKTTAKKTAKK